MHIHHPPLPPPRLPTIAIIIIIIIYRVTETWYDPPLGGRLYCAGAAAEPGPARHLSLRSEVRDDDDDDDDSDSDDNDSDDDID